MPQILIIVCHSRVQISAGLLEAANQDSKHVCLFRNYLLGDEIMKCNIVNVFIGAYYPHSCCRRSFTFAAVIAAAVVAVAAVIIVIAVVVAVSVIAIAFIDVFSLETFLLP